MGVREQVEAFRSLRRELEEAVLPLSTSLDGRGFSFQASLHGLEFETGGYVVLEDDSGARLGQVLTLEHAQMEGTEAGFGGDGGDAPSFRTRVPIRAAVGEGTILEGDGRPFHDVLARPAAPEEVAAHLERVAPSRARLEVGELTLAPGVSFALDAGGFDRHSFLCGQSGSGKTYALGAVLERLLAETTLDVVILDPNSDFVRLGEARPGVDEAAAARHAEAARGVAVRRAGAEGGEKLSFRLLDLDPAAQAATLRLDPVGDREEYAIFLDAVEEGRPAFVEELAESEHAGARQLALRARTLGVTRWSVWAGPDGSSIVEELDARSARCLVIDLGSLPSREEETLAAIAVLGALWRARETRRPVLIVIDEAHNVCPAEPPDELGALATDLAVRIAAEGRKFGLYLLVSTQRPQKVHENVISQCDNLLLMRMNSARRPRIRRRRVLVRAAEPARTGDRIPAGRVPRRRQDRAAPGAHARRSASRGRGRLGRPRHVGRGAIAGMDSGTVTRARV